MTFEELLKNWSTEIQALKETMLIAQLCNVKVLDDKDKEIKEFIKTNCKIVEKKSENDFSYEIPDSVYTLHLEKKKEINKFTVACSIFPRMFIVTLLCQYDALIGSLVRLVLTNKPDILNGSEKTLTFKQLAEFKSMDEAKESIIAKEIETILRESHDVQLKWFENKLSIKLHEDKELISKFIEITERRNLFTHNNGIVNESYLSNCNRFGINPDVKIGDVLEVEPTYFSEAADCIMEIGIKLIVILWRKTIESEIEKTESVTNQIAYGFIAEENYNLALKILDFCLACFKPFKTSLNKLMIVMNKAQCLLWLKQEEQSKKLLDSQDWSLCTPQFILCKKVLERKFSEAIDILKTQDTQLDQIDLMSWPIFKEFREEQIFKDYYSEKYPNTIKDFSEEMPNNIIEAEEQLKKDAY
ncbi:hypothetical protein MSI_20960 [Treponema sp. JC4]|uniref:hypothetical protein n=1 Tax=Treponema sp. JC4 TaxID=1124982 RepID=UPI00025B0AE1|nr:hypothetical protein [Treponema sp. JC4]EID84450.1 hypothetical protein MSI_20960 [Treponema sp. JC4]